MSASSRILGRGAISLLSENDLHLRLAFSFTIEIGEAWRYPLRLGEWCGLATTWGVISGLPNPVKYVSVGGTWLVTFGVTKSSGSGGVMIISGVSGGEVLSSRSGASEVVGSEIGLTELSGRDVFMELPNQLLARVPRILKLNLEESA